MPNNLKKTLLLNSPFPYSIAEDGGNCVPMYSNKCSENGKKLFKDYIGSCTEAKFIVSDWGDTMKQRPKCCETAMKKYYETAPIIICESRLYTPNQGL